MKVWHHRANGTLRSVNGVDTLIYTLAREQSFLGHDVAILIQGPVDESAISFAENSGVELLEVPYGLSGYCRLASLAHRRRPDLVHMHSAFIPEQWIFGNLLAKFAVPFVVTPHGGFSPHVLARSRAKKKIYSSLVERPHLGKARGISVVTPQEKSEICSFLPRFRGSIAWIPNAVDPSFLENFSWHPSDTPKIVYLGRFDVAHKGIDILLKIAQELRYVEFHLYGPEDEQSKLAIERIGGLGIKNVTVHPPVYGAEKAAVLASATLYAQMSRWEAFGISIAEAMYVGLPCAVASTMYISSVFEDYGLGLVVEPDPRTAAQLIRAALSSPSQLKQWSEKARSFAKSNFQARAVAARFLDFYRECVGEAT